MKNAFGTKVALSLSTISAAAFGANIAYRALESQLNPRVTPEVAAQCLITTAIGRQIVFQNLGLWDQVASDAIVIKLPSAKDVFDDCAARIEQNQSIGMISSTYKYWDVTSKADTDSKMPNGGVPYQYDESGRLVQSAENLGNKWLAAQAASKLRDIGGSVDELNTRYHAQSSSWDNLQRQVTDRLPGNDFTRWVSKHVL